MTFDTKNLRYVAAFAAVLLVATPEQSHAPSVDFWDFIKGIGTQDLGSGR